MALWFFIFSPKKIAPLATNSYLFSHLEINGTDFGRFDLVKNHDLAPPGELLEDHPGATTLRLKRNFIVETSLYQWALNHYRNRQTPTDITLVQRKSDGYEVSRYLLKLSKPISWSIESNLTNVGGFHEEVEISAQKIVRQ